VVDVTERISVRVSAVTVVGSVSMTTGPPILFETMTFPAGVAGVDIDNDEDGRTSRLRRRDRSRRDRGRFGAAFCDRVINA
jgi:hypothetical protein